MSAQHENTGLQPSMSEGATTTGSLHRPSTRPISATIEGGTRSRVTVGAKINRSSPDVSHTISSVYEKCLSSELRLPRATHQFCPTSAALDVVASPMAHRGDSRHSLSLDDDETELEAVRHDNAVLCERLEHAMQELTAAEDRNRALVARQVGCASARRRAAVGALTRCVRQSSSQSQLVRELADLQARVQVQRDMLREADAKLKQQELALRVC